MKNFFSKFEENFIAFLLITMTLINVANVFVRYVMKSNISWALEYSIISFGWLIILGAAWGVKVGGHIGIDTVINLFSKKTVKFVNIISCILCIIYGTIILIGSYTYVSKIYSVGISSQDIEWLPAWMPRAVMVFGFGLLVFRFCGMLVRIIKDEQRGLGLMNEAKEVIDSIKFKKTPKKIIKKKGRR
jgi:C4-dicarboxylate transporter DctQ subunit